MAPVWTAFGIGLILGMAFGIFIVGLCSASKENPNLMAIAKENEGKRNKDLANRLMGGLI